MRKKTIKHLRVGGGHANRCVLGLKVVLKDKMTRDEERMRGGDELCFCNRVTFGLRI